MESKPRKLLIKHSINIKFWHFKTSRIVRGQ